ncbi:CorA metal ion transporter [Friedmanniomyces endolithicus]|nr:CorA metal ion transporter [Friedmanniomyces endolithicus]
MADQRDSLARISGPDSMAKPDDAPSSSIPQPQQSVSDVAKPKKKKTHRGGKNRRKTRRQSFATSEGGQGMDERPSLLDIPTSRSSANQHSFYRLQSGNRSNTSLESEALLDHREHGEVGRNRRESLHENFARPSLPTVARQQRGSGYAAQRGDSHRSRLGRGATAVISEDDEDVGPTDHTPLLSSSGRTWSKPDLARTNSAAKYGNSGTPRARRTSGASKGSIKGGKIDVQARSHPGESYEDDDDYDVNNPPSVPNSPKLGSLDDVLLDRHSTDRGRDAIISIDDDYVGGNGRKASESSDGMNRRPTVAELAERDVCFPGNAGMSEIGEEEDHHSQEGSAKLKRRRIRQWPQFEILEQWSREEVEERTHEEQIRAKRISEPVMVGGRLRPARAVWHREESEQPFRFTYFNELVGGTIHARTISDLLQDDNTFQDLFTPEPVELTESSDEEGDDDTNGVPRSTLHESLQRKLSEPQLHGLQKTPTLQAEAEGQKRAPSDSRTNTGSNTPTLHDQSSTPRPDESTPRPSKRYGARPTFWLDVLNPTDAEMTVLARTFGIHQLTTEDIMMEEQREKVELFNNYYFVNYRSFEQDTESENYLEPVNIYIVVFREGVLSFHHSMTPHPANVRRRIRQLNDYMSPSADWISYSIIDDVTDVYLPLVQAIETEVDDIDDCILGLHDDERVSQQSKITGKGSKTVPSGSEKESKQGTSPGDMSAHKAEGDKTAAESGGDMLRRVGECRKKVMSLYRLLGNKADVIKGFAKRCNEHWHVAPRSEIGLYLGDIQDHIVTMTGNLSHYENLLSRAHSNYLAQINIRMNERAELTADVLGKLTVLGTIVLPMNIVTGMWGMNVWVPGQDTEHDLTWFWCITAGLVAFGCTCFLVAKRVYGIV